MRSKVIPQFVSKPIWSLLARRKHDCGRCSYIPVNLGEIPDYGILNLKGKSVAERAKALIGIAHPEFRESLERQAYEHRLIPHGVSF